MNETLVELHALRSSLEQSFGLTFASHIDAILRSPKLLHLEPAICRDLAVYFILVQHINNDTMKATYFKPHTESCVMRSLQSASNDPRIESSNPILDSILLPWIWQRWRINVDFAQQATALWVVRLNQDDPTTYLDKCTATLQQQSTGFCVLNVCLCASLMDRMF